MEQCLFSPFMIISLRLGIGGKVLTLILFTLDHHQTRRSLYSLILQNFKVHSPIFLGQQLTIHPETWKKIVFLKQCRHLQRLSFKKHRILLIYFIIKRSKTFSSVA